LAKKGKQTNQPNDQAGG